MLTRAKLTEIVKTVLKCDKAELLDFSVKPGSETGDNFSGELCAVYIKAKDGNGTEKEFNWMVKLPSVDESRKPLALAMHMEEKEVDVYNRIVPAFKKLIADNKAEKVIDLNICECFYADFKKLSDTDFQSIIVLENLKSAGYRDPIDKKTRGLGLEYAKTAMKEIGQWHALGYAYLQSVGGPDKEPELCRDYFANNREPFMQSMMDSFKQQNFNLVFW